MQGTKDSGSAADTWVKDHLKSLDRNALSDPSNATKSDQLVAGDGTAKSYAYNVTNSAGTSCESDDTTCAKYTLTATYEGTVNGASTYKKSNLD
jgi:hypothetical protein